MKVNCSKEALAHGLAIIGHALPSKNALSILSQVKIVTHSGCVHLAATNLEIGIVCKVPATIEEAGEVAIPAKALADFVNFLPHDTLILHSLPENHECRVKSTVSEATMRGMDASEFPQLPEADDSPYLTLSASLFKEMINTVAFAAATSDDRPILTGIYMEIVDGVLTCAAADTFRLAVRNTPVPQETLPFKLLVPAKTLKGLASILPGEESVSISITPNQKQVVFTTPNVTMCSRLLEGEYVNYRNMLPQDYEIRAVLDTHTLLPILKTAAVFAEQGDQHAAITFQPGTGENATIKIVAASADLGTNTSVIAADYGDTAGQSNLSMILKITYVLEALAAIGSKAECAIELREQNKPAVIRPIGLDAAHIIMPMQVKTNQSAPAVRIATPS